MELSAEVVVEEGDVELSLGLSLGGHCNKAVVPLKAYLNQRSGEEAGDPGPVRPGNVSPMAEKEREGVGMLNPVRRMREKVHRCEENDLVGKKRRKQQQLQRRLEDEESKRQKVMKGAEAERINGEIASPRFNPSSNTNPNPNPTPNHSDDLKSKAASNARPPPPPPPPPLSNTAESDLAAPPHGAFPMVPVQYPYPPPQCLPFGFPYMVPWWSFPASSGSAVSAAQGTNVFQPVPSRSFVPFHASGGKEASGATNRLPSLSASQGSSFSAISDFHSGSHQGGSSSCSSDTRSNMNHAVEEKSQGNSSAKPGEPQQHSFSELSPDQVQPTDKADVESTDNDDELVPNSTKCIEGPTTQSITKATPESNNNNNPVKHERTGAPLGKSEALAGDYQANSVASPLPDMPCVTTTGNGPNGKKITGFLYRYNKNEVSIVCVCHGSSFSPAEFIKHAGGTEVSHPLRHIVIVPSS